VSDIPRQPIAYAPVGVQSRALDGGGCLLRSTHELAAFDPSLAHLFRSACDRHPDRVFLAERDDAGAWRKTTYAEMRRLVDATAAALIERGLSAERPVVILSGNSIDHAALMLAGHTAGIPVAPVSVAYSLQSGDLAKIGHIAELLTPGLVYAADTGPFARALAVFDCEVVTSDNSAGRPGTTMIGDLTRTAPGPAVEAAVAAIGSDTIAKFLFTSGSTGLPKAVINTHGMLTANQQGMAQLWPFLDEQPLVLVDWLPWNHTFGANHNFNMMMRHAGTMYIDAGKPAPGLFETTVRNLANIAPTVYFNVPAGFAALLPHLEGDERFARFFFSRLRLIFYAAAALPQDLWSRLETVSVRATGKRVNMTSSWGSTETAPAATTAHFPLDRAGVIGVPLPGVELKLVPSGERLEARVKGPNVTPGYWRSPEQTAAAFDDDGFYRIDDAVRLADPDDPARGIVYDGRIAEDFKLTSGTWVRVGALRVGVVAAASPVVQDVVVAGEGRDHVAVLAWLNPAGCAGVLGEDAPGEPAALVGDGRIHAHIRDALAGWNADHTGASMRIARVLLLDSPPSIDANEITDKGYVNQRAALAHRADAVAKLFGAERSGDIVYLDG